MMERLMVMGKKTPNQKSLKALKVAMAARRMMAMRAKGLSVMGMAPRAESNMRRAPRRKKMLQAMR
jgi:hypothetical protein